MDDATREFVEGLKVCFRDLKDPRVVNRCDHLLSDIVAIAILAMMSGADDWTDIELFGRLREDWLRQFLELPNGIPSHDTFQRVFGLLDRKEFAVGLFTWTRALHEASGGKLVSLDGKSLRRSHRHAAGLGMLHLVTAWSSDNGLTLGQVAVADKSNEITAIPEVLKVLNLKGCTVTIDAMGCQKEIAEQIRDQKGHYVLALKDNQPGLAADLRAVYEQAAEDDFAGWEHDVYETRERGHGRIEERTCHVLAVPEEHPQRAVWKDLHTLATVVTCRQVNGQEHWEARLYISSHRPQAKMLAQAIRKHWSIENSQHWVLDVAFREDDRRQQDRNGAANLAAVRRLAVSLLRQDRTLKNGAKAKRMAAALDPNYLLRVLRNARF